MLDGLTFTDKLVGAIKQKRSILCVGIDPQLRFIPPHLIALGRKNRKNDWEAMGYILQWFGGDILDAIVPYAIAVKLNTAFYESYGSCGMWALEQTIVKAQTLGLQIIGDAKRGDGDDAAQAYAQAYLGEVPFFGETTRTSPFHMDALTIQPWSGSSCFDPFLKIVKEQGKGAFVFCKSSFIPNSQIEQTLTKSNIPMWQALAHIVQEQGKGTEGKCGYRNFGVVMGATYPDVAEKMRDILPNAWFLIPGYGVYQGGGSDGAVVGINNDGLGGLVNSSRGVIAAWQGDQFQCEPEGFADAAAQAAEAARDDLNEALQRAGKLAW